MSTPTAGQASLLPLHTVLSEGVKKKVTSSLTNNQLQSYRSSHGILSFSLRSVLHEDKENVRIFFTVCEIVLTLLSCTFSGTEFMSLFSVSYYTQSIPLKLFHFGLETLGRESWHIVPESTVSENLRFSQNKEMNSQIFKEEKSIVAHQGQMVNWLHCFWVMMNRNITVGR